MSKDPDAASLNRDEQHPNLLSEPSDKTNNRSRKNGGAGRDRTDDLKLAKLPLSQLSYGPIRTMVGPGRLELPTSRLSGVRSNHLSYRPDACVVRPTRTSLMLEEN